MIKKLDAIKIYEIAESGNTGWSRGNNEKHAKLSFCVVFQYPAAAGKFLVIFNLMWFGKSDQ